MSWLLNPEGDRSARAKRPTKLRSPAADGEEPTTPGTAPDTPLGNFPLKDDYPKVHDPSDPSRMVSTKQANRPFLAYADYRKRREQEHEAWVQRQKERKEKLARGEEVGPEERDPTEEPEIGCLGLLKFIVYALIFIVLAGKFFTGSFLWEQELPNISRYFPTNERLFSESMLAKFDGTIEDMPIYVAIDGNVYDVTEGRATYGPGGSYHFMAGRDAARAFATGCFATHRTHDIRGLTEKELHGLEHWKNFYATHKKYRKVGRVSHPPIDPASPIPEHCNPKKAKNAEEGLAKAAQQKPKNEDDHTKHNEL